WHPSLRTARIRHRPGRRARTVPPLYRALRPEARINRDREPTVSDFPLNFTAESLIAEAREHTGGLEDFGPGPFVEPLGIFVDSLRDDALLNPTGVHIAKTVAMGHIVNRLNYVNDRKLYPRIAEQKIVKPV